MGPINTFSIKLWLCCFISAAPLKKKKIFSSLNAGPKPLVCFRLTSGLYAVLFLCWKSPAMSLLINSMGPALKMSSWMQTTWKRTFEIVLFCLLIVLSFFSTAWRFMGKHVIVNQKKRMKSMLLPLWSSSPSASFICVHVVAIRSFVTKPL